jgi:hypothetical protein
MELLSERYRLVQQLIDEGNSKLHQDESTRFSIEGIDFKQERQFREATLSLLKKATEDQLNECVELCKKWCEEDAMNRDITASPHFPVLIRGKDAHFGMTDPPLTLTATGVAKVVKAHATDERVGISASDAKRGLLSSSLDIVDSGEYITVKSVPVSKWKMPRHDDDSAPEYDVMPVERLGVRWSENQKNLPIRLSAAYMLWFEFMDPLAQCDPSAEQKMESKQREAARQKRAERYRDYGIIPLGAGIIWMSLEFGARRARKVLKRNAKFDVTKWLQAWINGDAEKMYRPQWLVTWSELRYSKYPSASEYGITLNKEDELMTWCDFEMSRQLGKELQKKYDAIIAERKTDDNDAAAEGVLDAMLKGTPDGVPILPFIERSRGKTHLLTQSACSTSAFQRVALCLIAAHETLSSYDLKLHEYIAACLEFLGGRPGQRGKALSNLLADVPRLLVTQPRMQWFPTHEIPASGPAPGAEWKYSRDDIGLEVLAEQHDIDTSSFENGRFSNQTFESITRELEAKIFAQGDRVLDAAKKVYVRYKHAAVGPCDSAFLRVVTYFLGPAQMEGHSTSARATMSATYANHEVRKTYGSDTRSLTDERGNLRPMIAKMRDMWKDILRDMDPPTYKQLQESLARMATARSASGYSVSIPAAREDILGVRLPDSETRNSKEVNINGKTKSAVIWGAGDRLLETLKTVERELSTHRPGMHGERSVAGRALRFIYDVPPEQQAIIYPTYKAAKKWMRDPARIDQWPAIFDDGTQMKRHRLPLNMNITSVNTGATATMAPDASSMDQHSGPAIRYGVLLALQEATFRDSNIVMHLDRTYRDLLVAMYGTYDSAVFTKVIDPVNRIKATIRTDSNPSGMQHTTEMNGTFANSVAQLMDEATDPTRYLHTMSWGDDMLVHVTLRPKERLSQLIKVRDAIGLEAGLKFTTGDAFNGTCADFLKRVYYAGQIIPRRMPVTTERKQPLGLGAPVAEIMKYSEAAERGGNSEAVAMMTLILLCSASRTTLFGKKATVPFGAMAAPGGLTNLVFQGFVQPNSRLWLSVYWPMISGKMTEVETIRRPQPPTEREASSRILTGGGFIYMPSEDELKPIYARNTVKDVDVKVHIPGLDIKPEKASERLSKSSKALLNVDRLKTSITALRHPGFADKFYDIGGHPYEAAIVHGFGQSIAGSGLSKFRLEAHEAALISSGYIPAKRGDQPMSDEQLAARAPKPVVVYTGLRIGSETLKWVPDSGYRITSTIVAQKMTIGGVQRSLKQRIFSLIDGKGNTVDQYEPRWHPFCGRPAYIVAMLSFFGVSVDSQMSKLNVEKPFDPSKFRKDFSSSSVIGLLSALRDDDDKVRAMSALGFSDTEIGEARLQFNNLGIIRDLIKVDDYSGLGDVLSSIDMQRVKILMQHAGCAESSTPDGRRVSRRQFVDLVVNNFNIAFSSESEGSVKVVLPRLEITSISS